MRDIGPLYALRTFLDHAHTGVGFVCETVNVVYQTIEGPNDIRAPNSCSDDSMKRRVEEGYPKHRQRDTSFPRGMRVMPKNGHITTWIGWRPFIAGSIT